MLYSFVCIVNLTGIPRRGELRHHFSQPRPGFNPEFQGQLVARQKLPGRPGSVPVQAVGDHLAGQFHVGSHHLLAGDPGAAPGRQPVGDREQRHINRNRIGAVKVGKHLPPVQGT